MNKQRFVVTDQVWQRLERHLPGKSSDAGATAKDIQLFRKRFSGVFAPGLHGAICHLPSATGTASFVGSEGWRKRVFAIVFS